MQPIPETFRDRLFFCDYGIFLSRLTLADKQHAEGSGTAVGGYGAACRGLEDLFKARLQLVYLVADSVYRRLGAACVGNENSVTLNILAVFQALGHVVENDLVYRAAELFAGKHSAARYLNAGFELEQVSSQSRYRRAAAALAEIIDAVYNKARLYPAGQCAALLGDLLCGRAVFSHFAGVENHKTRTGREIARIDNHR